MVTVVDRDFKIIIGQYNVTGLGSAWVGEMLPQ